MVKLNSGWPPPLIIPVSKEYVHCERCCGGSGEPLQVFEKSNISICCRNISENNIYTLGQDLGKRVLKEKTRGKESLGQGLLKLATYQNHLGLKSFLDFIAFLDSVSVIWAWKRVCVCVCVCNTKASVGNLWVQINCEDYDSPLKS